MSGTMTIPYFGRAYQVTVNTANGETFTLQSGSNGNGLRITFTVDLYMAVPYWFADVVVYGLTKAITGNPLHARQALVSGDYVTLSAGYEMPGSPDFNAPSNLLFSGRLYQSLWEAENVVDKKLTMRCATGFLEDAYNNVNISVAAGSTDYDAIQAVCSPKPKGANLAILEIDNSSITELKQTSHPSAQTFFGSPYEIIATIVKPHGLFFWLTQGGLIVRAYNPTDIANQAAKVIYSPPGANIPGGPIPISPTIIGTPVQTQEGVIVRVLLDSQVHVGDLVQLAPGTFLNQFRFDFGNPKAFPPIPNHAGIYVVQGVRHVGDSRGRGNDWFTELVCLTRGFFNNFLDATDPATQSQSPSSAGGSSGGGS